MIQIDTVHAKLLNGLVLADKPKRVLELGYGIGFATDEIYAALEYNQQPAIKTNLAYLILKIIQFSYYSYYVPFENTLVRKFDSLLLIDAPYIDESTRVIGIYQELVNVKEIDDEVNKEKEMDMNEEQNALDIDEYDENDVYEDQDPSDDVVDNLIGE